MDLVYTVSWIVAGGLAGLAGGFISLSFIGKPDTGTGLLPSIFAASIVGGFFSIYGAMLGGCLIGFTEILGTFFLSSWLGAWVIPYRLLIPLAAMAITLLVAPKGITGINWTLILKTLKVRFSGAH